MHGPLAAQITEDGKATPLFPKPADAVYMRKDGRKEDEIKTEVLQLKPEDINEDANETDTWSDLPKGLLPVYPEKELSGKPIERVPIGGLRKTSLLGCWTAANSILLLKNWAGPAHNRKYAPMCSWNQKLWLLHPANSFRPTTSPFLPND